MNEAQISRQHPIPQNFMDVEFKIVGEFTVRQFTYLCVTGFPMYLIFNSPLQSFIKTVVLIILGIFGFLLVFVPIDDRSMDVWIVNFFRSVYSHNRRTWRKTPVIPKTLSMETIRLVQGEMITLAPTSSRRKLEEYLKGIKQEDTDEFDFDFKKFKYNEVYSRTTQPVSTTIAPEISVKEVAEITQPTFVPEIKKETPIQPVLPATPTPPITTLPIEAPSPKIEKPAIEEVVIKIPQAIKPETPKTNVVERPTSEIFKKFVQPIKAVPTNLREIIKPKPQVQAHAKDIHEELRTSSSEMPGRKFVSFSEREQEIILPIRGEKVIQIQQPSQVSSTKDIRTLTKELRTLVREIKKEEPPKEVAPTPAFQETQTENNLTGVCFDSNNNPLPNLMLALLDEQDREIQYTRTDNLGKFTFKNTSFATYKIKVLNSEIYSLNFDIISFSVTKYPYTFIQILGKK